MLSIHMVWVFTVRGCCWFQTSFIYRSWTTNREKERDRKQRGQTILTCMPFTFETIALIINYHIHLLSQNKFLVLSGIATARTLRSEKPHNTHTHTLIQTAFRTRVRKRGMRACRRVLLVFYLNTCGAAVVCTMWCFDISIFYTHACHENKNHSPK